MLDRYRAVTPSFWYFVEYYSEHAKISIRDDFIMIKHTATQNTRLCIIASDELMNFTEYGKHTFEHCAFELKRVNFRPARQPVQAMCEDKAMLIASVAEKIIETFAVLFRDEELMNAIAASSIDIQHDRAGKYKLKIRSCMKMHEGFWRIIDASLRYPSLFWRCAEITAALSVLPQPIREEICTTMIVAAQPGEYSGAAFVKTLLKMGYEVFSHYDPAGFNNVNDSPLIIIKGPTISIWGKFERGGIVTNNKRWEYDYLVKYLKFFNMKQTLGRLRSDDFIKNIFSRNNRLNLLKDTGPLIIMALLFVILDIIASIGTLTRWCYKSALRMTRQIAAPPNTGMIYAIADNAFDVTAAMLTFYATEPAPTIGHAHNYLLAFAHIDAKQLTLYLTYRAQMHVITINMAERSTVWGANIAFGSMRVEDLLIYSAKVDINSLTPVEVKEEESEEIPDISSDISGEARMAAEPPPYIDMTDDAYEGNSTMKKFIDQMNGQ